MPDLQKQILTTVTARNYHPIKAKALARKLAITPHAYEAFKEILREMIHQGRLELTKSRTIRPAPAAGTVVGVFRKNHAGFGFVRPHVAGAKQGPEIYIPVESVGDAATGDEVMVKINSRSPRPDKGPRGQIVRVLERSTRQFVGTYFERDGQGLVRVDGTVFSHSIYVGDSGAKGARVDDKVVVEMLRFPTAEDRGEGVITEILGPRGQPGVDTLSIIRGLGLPDQFPEDVLEEARLAAARFTENDLGDRRDFTGWTTITIDPIDARDFDDAVSLDQDSKSKHWHLGVHIADVGHFAPPGTALDREARKRATSIYLPQKVIPMFPEIISNSLASLQEGRVRFVKTVLIDFTPAGQVAQVQFFNGAIQNKKRFTYEQVSELLNEETSAAGNRPHRVEVSPEIFELLHRMRDLALILRKRRLKRGALELSMPQAQLEYDDQGQISGAHFAKHDLSHQIIEEFMLAANEAVASKLDHLNLFFLRRIHPAPLPEKLKAFAEFAGILGYKIQRETDRHALQRILRQSADQPEAHAVHYALLRSLKQAVYSPDKEDHYALASENYCHFTSPIRRYPDLVVHRLLDQLIKRGKAGSSRDELAVLGDHCSKMERRAELAERELVKMKLLTYMSTRVGLEMDAVITGVADYGFYAQAATLPVEGLVHISTLPDDYYYFDDASHSLIGQRTKRRFRLGDQVKVKAVRVDMQRRQLDFRVLEMLKPRGKEPPRRVKKRREK